MANNIPITEGQGQSSVAAEQIGAIKYQQIKVIGGETGSTSVMGVNPDRSINVSVLGVVATSGSSIIAATSVMGANDTETNSQAMFAGVNNGKVVGVVYPMVFNGSSWGRMRGDTTGGLIVQARGTSSFIGVIKGSVATALLDSSASVITVSQNSSVISVPVGSVITVWQDSSVLAVPVGSTINVWQTPSIVGTYAEDAAHSPGDKGVFQLGVRNENLTSVTSATNDYSQFTVGAAGEQIIADAPFTKWVSGIADLRVVQGASVTAIAAQGASVFTYVREVQVANFGSSSVLVKIAGGLGSTLGWTIAPAGGGSNFTTRYKTGENSAVTASINGTASVLVTVSGFTAGI